VCQGTRSRPLTINDHARAHGQIPIAYQNPWKMHEQGDVHEESGPSCSWSPSSSDPNLPVPVARAPVHLHTVPSALIVASSVPARHGLPLKSHVPSRQNSSSTALNPSRGLMRANSSLVYSRGSCRPS
jgi:hypothetical protein